MQWRRATDGRSLAPSKNERKEMLPAIAYQLNTLKFVKTPPAASRFICLRKQYPPARLRFSGIISVRTCRIRRQFEFEYKCAFCQARLSVFGRALVHRPSERAWALELDSSRPRATRGERRRRGREDGVELVLRLLAGDR